jgi:hypothetical protein
MSLLLKMLQGGRFHNSSSRDRTKEVLVVQKMQVNCIDAAWPHAVCRDKSHCILEVSNLDE